MKNIILADKAGFCFGVKKSFDKALELAQTVEGNVYTFGQLIHNEQAVEYLSQRGVACLDNELIVDVNKEDYIVIRAHGVPEETETKFNNISEVVDCTCPLVKKIHLLVRDFYNKGYKILIVGNEEHPEIIGINGWCYNSAFITRDKNSIPKFSDKVVIVSQTTEKLAVFNEIVDTVKKTNPQIEVIVKNTICDATSARQNAVKDLAKISDTVIVIGGKKSSNTRKLFEISKEICEDTLLISQLGELNLDILKDKETIGVTAGASTPDWIIKEVIEGIKNI